MAQKAHRNECNEVEHKRDGASMRMRLDTKQATTASLMYMAHCNTRPKGSTTPSSTLGHRAAQCPAEQRIIRAAELEDLEERVEAIYAGMLAAPVPSPAPPAPTPSPPSPAPSTEDFQNGP